jgi:hypothetical protein
VSGADTEEEREDALTFLKGHHVWLACGTGGMVANIYYIQPLLSTIAADFRISVSIIGVVAMVAAGMRRPVQVHREPSYAPPPNCTVRSFASQ